MTKNFNTDERRKRQERILALYDSLDEHSKNHVLEVLETVAAGFSLEQALKSLKRGVVQVRDQLQYTQSAGIMPRRSRLNKTKRHK